MAKVLFFSDLHVHQHKHSSERLQDCLDVLEWTFETAEENGVETIIFLGDLFHDRQKIDVLTYQRVFEIFERYIGKKIKKIYLLLGNHDLWHWEKCDVSSVFPLRSIPGVIIVDRPSTIDIEGCPISFLPYTHNPIADLALIQNDANWKVLCAHVAVDGAIWNVMHGIRAEVSVEHDGDMYKVDTGVFAGWDQVYLGHYHARQLLNEYVEYLGSPLQLSFGEAFQDKYIMILDLATRQKQYIENTFSPKHFIIRQQDLEKYPLEGNFVRVLVDDIAKSDIIELRHDIVSRHNVSSLEINQAETIAKGDEHLVEEAKSILKNQTNMLEEYVQLQEEWGQTVGLETGKLIEIGKQICTTDIDD